MTTTVTLPPKPASLDGKTKKLLIDGKFVESASGKTFQTINPSTGETLATVYEGDKEDVNRAVAAARRAFEGPWRKMKPAERQLLMLRLADLVEKHYAELAMLDSLDMGAPASRMAGSKPRILATIRYNAGMATALQGKTIDPSGPGEYACFTLKEPVGVVGAIVAWNAPLSMGLKKLNPALATGCTVVMKPPSEAPLSTARLGEIIMEAGFPPGVVNIVHGYGRLAGTALTSHMDVDKITFTGSSVTGQQIIQSSTVNVKRLTMELGGKSPNIVFADADLDAAVPVCAMAVFGNAGQSCSAGARLFVQDTIYEKFVERVAAYGRNLRVGNSVLPTTDIGPIISKKQLDSITEYMALGSKEGAVLRSGGRRLTEGDMAKGFFLEPTVFANVRNEMRLAQEEIFGPVIAAIPFKDGEEVARLANENPFGLASGIWTQDITKAHRLARALKAGSVWVNCYQAADPAVPFGGYKMSGFGRESGTEQYEHYLETKAVWIKIG